MPRESSVPKEVLAHVPCKCCRLRKDNDIYRVYKYSAVKLPSGKWSSDYGYLIGKILPDVGFVPNKRYLKELEAEGRPVFPDGITDVAYGQYALLMQLADDVLARLRKFFPHERALQIFCYGLILCANGFVHVDQVDDFFQESMLSIVYDSSSFKMGRSAISNLLHELGSHGEGVRAFEQSLIDECSGNVAIDGHAIRSCSTLNDLAEPGYKTGELKADQVNLLIAFDTHNGIPLIYRSYRGSSLDKKSVLDLLESRAFRNTKFVVDRGFYSSAVLEMMSENGNSYIIPLPSSSPVFKRLHKSVTFSSGEFIYRSGKNDSARIVFQEEDLGNGKRVIVYKDVDENNSKRKNYLRLLELGENAYTQENYEAAAPWMGVYFLQTNAKGSAAEIFADYKARWSIETFNNYIKNDAAFSNLKIQDYYTAHGFDFIMLVTGLIHSKLNDAVRALGKPGISTFDILIKAGHMRMVKRNGEWTLHNTRTKDLELLEKIGFIPQSTIQAS